MTRTYPEDEWRAVAKDAGVSFTDLKDKASTDVLAALMLDGLRWRLVKRETKEKIRRYSQSQHRSGRPRAVLPEAVWPLVKDMLLAGSRWQSALLTVQRNHFPKVSLRAIKTAAMEGHRAEHLYFIFSSDTGRIEPPPLDPRTKEARYREQWKGYDPSWEASWDE